MGHWLDTLTAWLGAHPQWLGLALFLAAFVECLAVIGLLVPGTLLLLAIAMLAGGGALGLGETLILAFFGGLLGDLLSYGLGRRYQQDIRQLRGLRSHPQWLLRAERYFHRYGIVSLLLGRFIGPLRPMLPMIAGMLAMPFARFVLVSLMASASWAMVFMLPGWTVGAALRLPLPPGFWNEAAMLLVLLTGVLGLSIHCSLQDRRRTSLLVAALCGLALLGLVIGWPHMVQFDEGLMNILQNERSVALDRLMVLITRLGDFRTQFMASALLTILLLLTRQWRPMLFAGMALLGTALGNRALKELFARLRPEILVDPLTSYSFPSGHSSAAFAFFLVLGVLAGRNLPPRLRLIWLLLASLPAVTIALSRIYLGAHWPTDIIAGALLAATFCATSLTLVQWHTPLPPLSPRAWWLILPACAALLAGFATWALPDAMQLYRYQGG